MLFALRAACTDARRDHRLEQEQRARGEDQPRDDRGEHLIRRPRQQDRADDRSGDADRSEEANPLALNAELCAVRDAAPCVSGEQAERAGDVRGQRRKTEQEQRRKRQQRPSARRPRSRRRRAAPRRRPGATARRRGGSPVAGRDPHAGGHLPQAENVGAQLARGKARTDQVLMGNPLHDAVGDVEERMRQAMQTTPSSSATMMSPGATSCPAHTTVRFTAPAPCLVVP